MADFSFTDAPKESICQKRNRKRAEKGLPTIECGEAVDKTRATGRTGAKRRLFKKVTERVVR